MVPGHVTAIGPGLVTGKVDEPANFTILTNDAGEGNLALAVEGPSKVEIFSKDNKNGTCSVSYLPTAPGEYTVTVKFNNQHIPESPFIANIADFKQVFTPYNFSLRLDIPSSLSQNNSYISDDIWKKFELPVREHPEQSTFNQWANNADPKQVFQLKADKAQSSKGECLNECFRGDQYEEVDVVTVSSSNKFPTDSVKDCMWRRYDRKDNIDRINRLVIQAIQRKAQQNTEPMIYRRKRLVKRFDVNTKKVFCQNEGFKSTSDREENIEAYKEPVVLNQFVNCNFDGVTKLNMNSGDVNNNQLKDVWVAGPDQDGEIHFERNFTDTDHLSEASDWDQKLLRDKLEFHGIPKTKSENLRKTIISLVERLGVRLSDDDIVDCHRVPCREKPLHPIVVAKFANFRTRDLIHERRKRFACVTDFGVEGMTSMFVNESFTNERRGWLYKARQLLKSKVIAFLWTKFGKIWMRKSKDSKKIEVNAETVRAQLQES